MQNKKTAIAITGAYGRGNFGDDALMLAAIRAVKRIYGVENSKILILAGESSYVEKLAPNLEVRLKNDERDLNVDVLVYGGGTQFHSFPTTLWRKIKNFQSRVWTLVKSPRKAIKTFLTLLLSDNLKSARPSLIGLSLGLGPFSGKNYQDSSSRNANKIFGRMEHISVRDPYSYDLCHHWNYSTVRMTGDLCYMPNMWEAIETSSQSEKSENIKRIGVIPRDWPHTKEGRLYEEPLLEVVDCLRKEGIKVEFISFAKNYDKDWSRRLEGREEQFIFWDPEVDTIEEFLLTLNGFDSFITARYHGAVFASLLGKPVICIDIERKLEMISDLLEAGARLWSQPFIVSECIEHFRGLDSDYKNTCVRVKDVSQRQGDLVEEMLDDLIKSRKQAYSECPAPQSGLTKIAEE